MPHNADAGTPVLDALAAITAVSIVGSELPAREHVIARLAALVAGNAPPTSYLMNAGTAADVEITLEDVQSLLVAVAPVVGTPRVVAATGNIGKALGLAVALAEAGLEESDDEEWSRLPAAPPARRDARPVVAAPSFDPAGATSGSRSAILVTMEMDPSSAGGPDLVRRLGAFDAVVIGLGSMIGAGIFSALGPAAAAAGSGLLVALGVAAVVAYCNAMSSARLAARYPRSGGTYVYGRERLGPFWGYLAGWGFVVGKTASCAAMALTVGGYAWPTHQSTVAVGAVVGVTALNYTGVRKAAWLTRIIVALVLAVLAAVVTACISGGSPTGAQLSGTGLTAGGTLQAGGLLFFGFAGYARIATLGEEVRDPSRTIPRAIAVALGITLVVYAAVAGSVLLVLTPAELAVSADPLARAVGAAGATWLVPVVRIGATVGALGSLLALTLGVSRTALAMARDGHLPRPLAAVHPRYQVPHRAELAVGAVVAILAATVDVRGAIGFSSFGVLVYYAIANASARTLRRDERRPPRAVPLVGLAGCLVLAFTLPLASVLGGGAVLLAGASLYLVRGRRGPRGQSGS